MCGLIMSHRQPRLHSGFFYGQQSQPLEVQLNDGLHEHRFTEDEVRAAFCVVGAPTTHVLGCQIPEDPFGESGFVTTFSQMELPTYATDLAMARCADPCRCALFDSGWLML